MLYGVQRRVQPPEDGATAQPEATPVTNAMGEQATSHTVEIDVDFQATPAEPIQVQHETPPNAPAEE